MTPLLPERCGHSTDVESRRHTLKGGPGRGAGRGRFASVPCRRPFMPLRGAHLSRGRQRLPREPAGASRNSAIVRDNVASRRPRRGLVLAAQARDPEQSQMGCTRDRGLARILLCLLYPTVPPLAGSVSQILRCALVRTRPRKRGVFLPNGFIFAAGGRTDTARGQREPCKGCSRRNRGGRENVASIVWGVGATGPSSR